MNPVTGEHDTAIGEWRFKRSDGSEGKELLVSFDEGRAARVLILPAWFDEANRMRHFTYQTMEQLHRSGIDCLLPDLPGCNESLEPLDRQTLAAWREAALSAAKGYGVTHVLAIRAGALIAPSDIPGWHYAPQTGPKLLRGMIRARTIASREAGIAESTEELMQRGRGEGLTLAGWPIGREMFAELETATPDPAALQRKVEQSELGGAGLWLRAEPGEALDQSLALASLIAAEVTSAP